jgi:hypothetical protein
MVDILLDLKWVPIEPDPLLGFFAIRPDFMRNFTKTQTIRELAFFAGGRAAQQ